MFRVWLTIAVAHLALALLNADKAEPLTRYEFSQPHMGTVCRVVVYADSPPTAERAAHQALARIQQLDQILSDYRDDSELMRLCAQPARQPHRVGPDLLAVLHVGQQVATASEGAFDMTVGPLSQLWRRARRQKKLPTPAALAAARMHVGYPHLQVDANAGTVQMNLDGMRLDLGGIAKGYAADQALAVLRQAGLPRAMVVVGGEVAVGTAPPGQAGWKVAIAGVSTPTALVLVDAAVSTSGDAEQFVELDGQRFSHIIDPRTGQALTASPQVTVMTREGIWADALATAASVLSEAQVEKLLARYPPAAALVRRPTAAGWQEQATQRWKEWIK
jgi:thiamine biosynthesis lipoprotein